MKYRRDDAYERFGRRHYQEQYPRTENKLPDKPRPIPQPDSHSVQRMNSNEHYRGLNKKRSTFSPQGKPETKMEERHVKKVEPEKARKLEQHTFSGLSSATSTLLKGMAPLYEKKMEREEAEKFNRQQNHYQYPQTKYTQSKKYNPMNQQNPYHNQYHQYNPYNQYK